MSYDLETKQSQFTRYILNLANDACTSLFALRREFPFDEEAMAEVSYYADLLFLRATFLPDRCELSDAENQILTRWSQMSLSRVCEEFCEILNRIIEKKIAAISKKDYYVTPDFSRRIKEIEEQLLSMASSQFEKNEGNQRKLALNA